MRAFVHACNLCGYFCGMKRLVAIIVTASFMYTIMMLRYEMLRTNYEEQLKNVNHTNLYNFKNKLKLRQNGDFWIYYNYILPEKQFVGNESITLITHGTHESLKGLNTLVKRWGGPVSITIFATDDNFIHILNDILYLRDCTYMNYFITSLVTFSFVFHGKYLPKQLPEPTVYMKKELLKCSFSPAYLNDSITKKAQPFSKSIKYPLNLMRNVGRYSVFTYYQLSLDMDMYTTPFFSQYFLNFVSSVKLSNPYKSVFCLPSFNSPVRCTMPNTVAELKRLINKNVSNIFNTRPNIFEDEFHFLQNWLNVSSTQLETFLLTRYIGKWQPYYISINDMEPLADERFAHETLYDRSMQIDILNYLKYDFVILSGGYTIHRGSTIEDNKFKSMQYVIQRAKINKICRGQNYILHNAVK